jgi:hypothetical protein
LKGLAAVSTPRRHFQKDTTSIYMKVYANKFEVSALRGGHIRNAASLSLPRPHCRARYIAELKSNKLSQWQTPDANNQGRKTRPAF